LNYFCFHLLEFIGLACIKPDIWNLLAYGFVTDRWVCHKCCNNVALGHDNMLTLLPMCWGLLTP